MDEATVNQRVAFLVTCVGGLAAAARICEVSPDTINNWRKDGAKLPLMSVFQLCVKVGLTLDWVATGQVPTGIVLPTLPGTHRQSLTVAKKPNRFFGWLKW